MPEQDPPARNRYTLGIAYKATDLAPHDQTARLGLQQLRHAHANLDTGFEIPMVQEESHIDDVHLAIQAPQRKVVLIEDIGGEERALERLAVAEEFVPQLHELAVEVGAVDVLAFRTVRDELADVLREAAAEVEEGLVGVAEAVDEGGVVRGEIDGKVQEKELADAGVGVDVPGFFALEG